MACSVFWDRSWDISLFSVFFVYFSAIQRLDKIILAHNVQCSFFLLYFINARYIYLFERLTPICHGLFHVSLFCFVLQLNDDSKTPVIITVGFLSRLSLQIHWDKRCEQVLSACFTQRFNKQTCRMMELEKFLPNGGESLHPSYTGKIHYCWGS